MEQHEEQHEAATAEIAAPKDVSSKKPSNLTTSTDTDSQSVSSAPHQSTKEPTPTTPTTPASISRSHADTASSNTPASGTKTTPRVAVPALPVVPALPKASAKEAKASRAEKQPTDVVPAVAEASTPTSTDAAPASAAPEPEVTEPAANPPAKAPPPSSWAKLFAKPAVGASGRGAAPDGTAQAAATVNGTESNGTNGATNGAVNNFSKTSSGSVAEAVQAYRLGGNEEVPFLEPRGLINTGNMCYMNSVSRWFSRIDTYSLLTSNRFCKF